MKCCPFRGRDKVSCRSGNTGIFQLYRLDRIQCRRDRVYRRVDFRLAQFREIASQFRNPKSVHAFCDFRRSQFDFALRADRVFVIRPLHRVIGKREVRRRTRERSQMIEARDEGKRPRTRKPAIGRLQAEQSAERGRHPDRAVGVGAERKRHVTRGDRTARAARGAAGHMRGIVRIARVTVMRVFSGEIIGVFAHVERTDQHRALLFQPFDQHGIVMRGRALAVDPGARAGRKPFHVEQVLHRERNARKRQALAARNPLVDFRRGLVRACRKYVGKRISLRIERVDPVQRGGYDARRALLLAVDRRSDLRCRHPLDAHGRNTGAGSASSSSSTASTSFAAFVTALRCTFTPSR